MEHLLILNIIGTKTMKVWACWTSVDWELLEVGSNHLVDGCFKSMDEVKAYCTQYGYELVL